MTAPYLLTPALNKGVVVPPSGYRWLYDLDGVTILADLDGSLMYEAI